MLRPDQEMRAARQRTDEVFSLLDRAYLYERPVAERHRLIFYLGHVDAFDWNLVGAGALSEPSLHPTFDRLFARGIDPDNADLPTDVPSDWPSVDEVLEYRRRVRMRIDELLEHAPPSVVGMAIEHRFMHAETLAYLIHNLPYKAKVRQEQPVSAAGQRTGSKAIDIPGATAALGRARDGEFGWDNEFERHSVSVDGFRIDRYKVTNGEYLDFVRAGGPIPHFWTQSNGAFRYRGMFEENDLPLDWPVYVTHSQAEAYTSWAGRRLPTEAEYAHARSIAGEELNGNSDFRRWDPEPVSANDGDPGRPHQLAGNGWEWTSTLFAPFPGFAADPNYPGYSADFFDGKHYVLKGASPRTARCFLRSSFRNWFRPDYPHVYATFRCVDR